MKDTKKKLPRVSGTVLESLPSLDFKVRLDDGREIIAHLAGKMRLFRIKILPGDRVTVEMTPYDEKRGRIVYRER
jgi:translation initiation factor IF-1